MMNHFINIILFFLTLTINCQSNTLIVDYSYELHPEALPNPMISSSQLISNGQYSVYEIDIMGNKLQGEESTDVNGNSVIFNKASKNLFIFKNYTTKEIYSTEKVITKSFTVKDSMNLFNWELQIDTKQILGYDCQKATMNYRGRDYTAYFTPDIEIYAGPWKFSGLPGVILEIQSNDSYIKIVANKIVLNKDETLIINPYQKIIHDAISWNEYLKRYNQKYDELSRFEGPNGGRITMSKGQVETLVETKYQFLKN